VIGKLLFLDIVVGNVLMLYCLLFQCIWDIPWKCDNSSETLEIANVFNDSLIVWYCHPFQGFVVGMLLNQFVKAIYFAFEGDFPVLPEEAPPPAYGRAWPFRGGELRDPGTAPARQGRFPRRVRDPLQSAASFTKTIVTLCVQEFLDFWMHWTFEPA
jgi:hypothetical protein